MTASGGTAPYFWDALNALPPGLTISNTGVISGTPTLGGMYSIDFIMGDSSSPQIIVYKTLTMNVAGGVLSVTTTSLSSGIVNAPYSTPLAAVGGAPPYTWSIASGSLPQGLSLNASTGIISGTPPATGTSSFTVQANDSATQSAQQALSISILAAAPLSITTGSLPTAQVNQSYSTTLQLTGGTPGYTWSITSGSLPAGMQLMATTGQITGTPSATGQSSFTVKVTDSGTTPQSATKSLTLTVSNLPTLDQYGGLVAKPSPNGATGYFRVEKFGNRWMFVTPDGHAFWMRAMYHAVESFLDPSVIPNKYGGSAAAWGTHRNQRLLAWGLNTLGEYASSRGLPVGVYGSTTGDPVPLPFIMILNGSVDGMSNPTSLGLPEAIKNVMQGVPTTAYNNYRGPLVDAFDPKLAQAQVAEVAYWNGVITGGFANKPWVIGITTDDGDNLYGFKSGACTNCVNAYPHIGFLVAVANFNYGGTWKDPKLYSKYAWITYLKTKYNNSIAALNSAWGTSNFYTSFDDAGGYGSGTGVIDEDGRHAWMGTMVYPYTNTGASPGVQADLDGFLYEFAKAYGQAAVNAVRAVDTNHLMFGPAALNNYGAKARDQILKGISDAGINVFQLNYDPLVPDMTGNNQSYDLTGKPAFIWYSVTAQADSGMSSYPTIYGQPNFSSQPVRGQHFASDVSAFLNAQGANGDYYVIGYDWWELVDNPGEGVNWGFTSRLDNAYDGNEAIIATGVDPWGYSTGGEAANYGDFISSVKSTHLNLMQMLLNTLP
jgi:hypothetical protein